MSTPEEEKENRDLQQEERLALEAIYGPDAVQTSPISDDALVLVVNIDQDAEGEVKSQRVMILHVFLPATYPSKEPPDFEVSSVYCGSRRVDGKMLETIKREFHNMFQPGQVVLFEWISWLRDYLESEVEKSVQDLTQQLEQQTLKDTKDSTASEEQTAATSNNKPNGTEEDDGEPTPEIFSSEPLVDRKSVFVAHVAAVHSAKQVQKVMSKLLENKKIAKATHNIMAYRIVLDDGRVLQDNDDDGETAAGGRLMHLMQILDVKNVVVVVSRWFGGILLGADRFKDINNCARKALEDCGYIKEEQMSTESKSNKSKRKK